MNVGANNLSFGAILKVPAKPRNFKLAEKYATMFNDGSTGGNNKLAIMQSTDKLYFEPTEKVAGKILNKAKDHKGIELLDCPTSKSYAIFQSRCTNDIIKSSKK